MPRSRGRAAHGRKRDTSDHVGLTTGCGIIDPTVWEAVQAKLKGVHAPAGAPRNPHGCRQLLFCGKCGKKMQDDKRNEKNPLAYTCSTYRRYGKTNPTGCRLHRVQHAVIERLLLEYLDETAGGISHLLDANLDGDLAGLLAGLEQSQELQQAEYLRAITDLWSWARSRGAKPPVVDGKQQPWSHSSRVLPTGGIPTRRDGSSNRREGSGVGTGCGYVRQAEDSHGHRGGKQAAWR